MRTEYRIKPEMLWKQDDQVDAARKAPGWGPFHRKCGEHKLYFDHIEREGKRGPYRCAAFTVEKRRDYLVSVHLADGTGKTPLAASEDAYRAASRPVADAELARLLGGDPVNFDDILGGDDAADMEDILG